MTAPQLTATVNLAGALTPLSALERAFKDVSPVFHGPIDMITTAALLAQFATSGRRLNGTPWKPLSLTTIQLRTRVVRRRTAAGVVARTTNRVGQARAGFTTPLRNTNRLWASLVKSGGPEGLRVITPSSYERGTRVRYAAGHQTGYTITQMFGRALKAPIRVPARPLVPENLPLDLVGEYEQALLAWLQDGAL